MLGEQAGDGNGLIQANLSIVPFPLQHPASRHGLSRKLPLSHPHGLLQVGQDPLSCVTISGETQQVKPQGKEAQSTGNGPKSSSSSQKLLVGFHG